MKIPWPGYLNPHPRLLFLKLQEIQLCVQEILRHFQIKLFPNITTLFYQSQLHVPLYVRGWGSRYLGLGILTPQPRLLFLKLQKIELCVQEMLRYFRIKLYPNITTLFYRSQLHVPLYTKNRGWGSRYRGLGILIPTPEFCFLKL